MILLVGSLIRRSAAIDYLCDELVTHDNVATVYVYCDYKDIARQPIFRVLLGFLTQLVQRTPTAFIHARALFELHHLRGRSQGIADLVSVLKAAIAELDRLYIVLDALDELSESDGDGRRLLNILLDLGPNVKA